MAMFSGESGMATIQETALRVCKAANVELASTGIIFCETVPRFGDPVNMEAFRRFLDADGIEVVIIDPVYLCLPCDINPANLFDIGRLLRSVSDVCREAGATPVLVHHLKKTVANPYIPGQLEDIGWAGFQEFFRQWLLINRREAYEPAAGCTDCGCPRAALRAIRRWLAWMSTKASTTRTAQSHALGGLCAQAQRRDRERSLASGRREGRAS